MSTRTFWIIFAEGVHAYLGDDPTHPGSDPTHHIEAIFSDGFQ